MGAGARELEALDPATLADVDLRLRPHQDRGRRRGRARLRAGGRCSTSATPSATRSRPPPATSATATARRSGSACSPRCGSRTPTGCAPRSRRCSSAHGLPTSLDAAVDADAVIEAIGRDKKATSEGLGFVLLERPGEPRWGERVEPDRVRAAVEELREMRQPTIAQPGRGAARRQLRHARRPRPRCIYGGLHAARARGADQGLRRGARARGDLLPDQPEGEFVERLHRLPERRRRGDRQRRAPGRTTPGRSATRSSSPACPRSRSTSPTSRQREEWRQHLGVRRARPVIGRVYGKGPTATARRWR